MAISSGFLFMLALELVLPRRSHPEGMAVMGLSLQPMRREVLRGSGRSSGPSSSTRCPRLLKLTAFSLATPCGWLLTSLLHGQLSGLSLSLALLFSAGTFLYVALVDVFLQAERPAATNAPRSGRDHAPPWVARSRGGILKNAGSSCPGHAIA